MGISHYVKKPDARMQGELDKTVLNILKDVNFNEDVDWKQYIPEVISSLRNGYAWWQGFDVTFHKTTNKLYRAVYDAVYLHVRSSIRASNADVAPEGGKDDNDQTFQDARSDADRVVEGNVVNEDRQASLAAEMPGPVEEDKQDPQSVARQEVPDAGLGKIAGDEASVSLIGKRLHQEAVPIIAQ